MAHVEPLRRADLPQFEPQFAAIQQAAGFVPNSMLTMAKIPSLLEAFSGLAFTVNAIGEIDRELFQLVAHAASRAARCRDRQAHTPAAASGGGTDPEKLEAVWALDTDDRFSEAEIIQVVACLSLFGFLNRWNDTMATTLEEEPLVFARAQLAKSGWEPGPHV